MNQNMKKHLAFGLVLILGISLAAFGLGASEALERVGVAGNTGIAVSGEASVQVAPDRAEVTLGVESQGSTAMEAQSRNAGKMDKIIQALATAGIDRGSIKTRAYSLNPVRRWNEKAGQEILVGYQASNLVTITTKEVNHLGGLLDTAVAAGADNVQNISFDVADKAKVQEQAMEQAVSKARHAAERMAKAAGVRLGKVSRMTDNTVEAPILYAQQAKATDHISAEIPPVQPGQVKITTRVEITFQIR